jgi:hypothetical protein
MLAVAVVVNILAQEAQGQVERVAVVTELWMQTVALELQILVAVAAALAEVQLVALVVMVVQV